MIQLVVWVALMVVAYMLRPKPDPPVNATPGEMDVTVVDASSPVPVLFGTRLASSPNLVWYGDIGTTPISEESGGK